MSKKLDDLDPRFKPRAIELLARCMERGIFVRVICTRRTAEEQSALVQSGASSARYSKHQDGLAMDICPVNLLGEKNWAPESPLWTAIGGIGRQLGLVWGGSWKTFDGPHFEMIV